ncbi:MAG: hypothetical protein NTY23_15080 [Chloroflexi bacterium]|nr:hypothetical protein [Chloroflexota bacterium]
MGLQHSAPISSNVILKVAACDLAILGAAACIAWFPEMRTISGFGQGSDMEPGDRGGLVQGIGRALSGDDAVLQLLLIIAGSGVSWAITGGLLRSFSR